MRKHGWPLLALAFALTTAWNVVELAPPTWTAPRTWEAQPVPFRVAPPALRLAGWTTPRTWATSELVTASIMNTHVRDNFDYLKTTVDTIEGAYLKRLAINTTTVGNVGAGVDVLQALTIPANTWDADGTVVEIRGAGRYQGGQTIELSIQLGSSAIVGLGAATPTGDRTWEASVWITRTGSNAQLVHAAFYVNGANIKTDDASFTETDTGSLTFQFYGESSSTPADNDIQQDVSYATVLNP